jgi:hypothetical protein
VNAPPHHAGLTVRSFAVDEALPADYIRIRAQALADMYPDDVSVCSAGQRAVCAVGGNAPAAANAGKVWCGEGCCVWQQPRGCCGGRGGRGLGISPRAPGNVNKHKIDLHYSNTIVQFCFRGVDRTRLAPVRRFFSTCCRRMTRPRGAGGQNLPRGQYRLWRQ